MLVRIRLKRGSSARKSRGRNRRVAVAMSTLLSPAALMCFVLAIWRLGADLKLTGEFAISDGVFANWQFWGGAAIALELCSWMLDRYAVSEKR